jgi:hypothetical protein
MFESPARNLSPSSAIDDICVSFDVDAEGVSIAVDAVSVSFVLDDV